MKDQPEQTQSTSKSEITGEKVEKLAPSQILQLISAVSSSPDLDGALRNLVDSLAMLYSDHQVSIFTPGKGNVYTFFFSGGKKFINLENQIIKPGEGILGSALKNLKAILIEDYGTIKEFLPIQAGITSELVVPIMFQSRLIALLDILSEKLHSFTTNDQTTLEALAASLSGILFTLQRSQYLKEKADREERINMIITQLSKINTVEESIKTAARGIAKMPEISQAAIYINPIQTPDSK